MPAAFVPGVGASQLACFPPNWPTSLLLSLSPSIHPQGQGFGAGGPRQRRRRGDGRGGAPGGQGGRPRRAGFQVGVGWLWLCPGACCPSAAAPAVLGGSGREASRAAGSQCVPAQAEMLLSAPWLPCARLSTTPACQDGGKPHTLVPRLASVADTPAGFPACRVEREEQSAKGPFEAIADTLRGAADFVKWVPYLLPGMVGLFLDSSASGRRRQAGACCAACVTSNRRSFDSSGG